MFKHSFDQFQKGTNFNQQFKQLTEILKRALGISPQFWSEISKKEAPDFVALQKMASEGPYGELLKQFNNSIIMLGIFEQYLKSTADSINELKKEIEELEDYDADEDKIIDDGRKAPAEKKEELIEVRDNLIAQKKNINNQYRYYRSQYALLLIKYVKSIEHFIAHVAVPSILERSKELGYRFNEKEKAMIETSVPRSTLEERLKDSYLKAQEAELEAVKRADAILSSIPDAPPPPPLPAIHRDFPKPEDFMARALVDLELRTLMALNANWNRQFNEMHGAEKQSQSINHANHNGAKSVNEARKMVQESANPTQDSPAIQQLKARHSVSQTVDREEVPEGLLNGQVVEEKANRRDSRVLYSVQDSLSLLKEFNATFKDLESRFKTLNDMHIGNIENMQAKMREHIEKEKAENKVVDRTVAVSSSMAK